MESNNAARDKAGSGQPARCVSSVDGDEVMLMLKLIAMWSQYLFTRGSRRRMNDAGTRCAVLSRCYCPDSGYGNPPPGEQQRARNVVSRYE